MRKLNKIKLIPVLAAISILGMVYPKPAQAFCGECIPTLIAVQQSTGTMLGAFNAAVAAITGAIELSSMELTLVIQGSTKAIIASNEKTLMGEKELTQAGLNYNAADKTVKNNGDATDQYLSDSAQQFKKCEILENAIKTSYVAEEVRVNVKASGAVQSQRNMYTKNAKVAAKEVLDDYKLNYCTKSDDEEFGRCTQTSNVLMQGASVKVDTLLSPTSNQTYSLDESKAAEAYIKTLSNPIPIETIPRAMSKSPGADNFILQQMNAQAILSVVQNSLHQIKASKDSPEGGAAPNAMGYSGDLSLAGMMKKFVNDKFGNPDYSSSLSGMNDTGLLKEVVMQTAYSNWMDYNAFMQNERVEAILATQLSISARDRAERQLSLARSMIGKTK